MIEVGFSYDDPPNKVREVLLEVRPSTHGVLRSQRRSRRPLATATRHELPADLPGRGRGPVAGAERPITRIWYMARRHGLTMPYPVRVNLQHPHSRPVQETPLPRPRPCSRSSRTCRRFPPEPDEVPCAGVRKGRRDLLRRRTARRGLPGRVGRRLDAGGGRWHRELDCLAAGPGGFFVKPGCTATTRPSAGRRPRRHRGGPARPGHRTGAVRGQPALGPRHRAGARCPTQGAAISTDRAPPALTAPIRGA